MTTSGPNSPSTSSQTSTGNTQWSSLSNGYSSNNSYTTNSVNGTISSETARFTGFSFSLSGTVTSIDGITVEIERKTTDFFGVKCVDSTVQLTKDGTTGVGSNYASASAWPTSDAYASYGGASDLWGTTWSQSDIESANFGLLLQIKGNGLGGPQGSVDHIRITVDYTTSGGGGGSVVRRRALMGVGR